MYELPTSVTVNGRQFTITNKGDFRMVLDCFRALSDVTMSEDLRVLASLIIFYNEFNSIEDVYRTEAETLKGCVSEMYKFFNQGQEQSLGCKTDTSYIDWDKDSILISSAINAVAGKEIRVEPYLHWWTFMGYYLAIGESLLATVTNIRYKIVKNIKLEKWEQKFRLDNPEHFTWNRMVSSEAAQQDEMIRNLWNKGGVTNG